MLTSRSEFDHRWMDRYPWALIDAEWRSELPADYELHILQPPNLGIDPDRCPVLLDLRTLCAADHARLMEEHWQQVVKREETLVSLFFPGELKIAPLARHLANRLALNWPGISVPKQFRYFDPGTFLQLPRTLGTAGMAWLLGPAVEVLVPWAGQWNLLTRPDSSGRPCRLGDAEQQALLRIGIVNRVLLQQTPPQSAMYWVERSARVDADVQRAVLIHGLTETADLVCFAQHADTVHPRFDAHPRVALLLREFSRRELNPLGSEVMPAELRELFDINLSVADWQSVAAELNAAELPCTSKVCYP